MEKYVIGCVSTDGQAYYVVTYNQEAVVLSKHFEDALVVCDDTIADLISLDIVHKSKKYYDIDAFINQIVEPAYLVYYDEDDEGSDMVQIPIPEYDEGGDAIKPKN